eukprot:4556158-Amphidinium_carterae.1
MPTKRSKLCARSHPGPLQQAEIEETFSDSLKFVFEEGLEKGNGEGLSQRCTSNKQNCAQLG